MFEVKIQKIPRLEKYDLDFDNFLPFFTIVFV